MKLTDLYDRSHGECVSRPDLVAKRNAARFAARIPRPDNRVRCYRPTGECYAILSPTQWRDLRSRGKLDAWLDRERDSGVIIDAGRAASSRVSS